MKIEVKTSTVVHTRVEIKFMKQEFSFESTDEVPRTIEKDSREDFKQYLIGTIMEVDIWDDRNGYNDILLRRVSGRNPGCTTPLMSIPCTAELKALVEKCERQGDFTELIDFLFKNEERLLIGWGPV